MLRNQLELLPQRGLLVLGRDRRDVDLDVRQRRLDFRDVRLGGWDNRTQRREVVPLEPPFGPALEAAGTDDLLLNRLYAPLIAVGTIGGPEVFAEQLRHLKQQAENGYEIVEFQDLATETQALTTGQIDAAINDLPVWTEAIKENKGATKIATQFDTGEQYGFGMKLGNDALKKVVDDAISTSKSDGTYASLYKKWIGQEPPQ